MTDSVKITLSYEEAICSPLCATADDGNNPPISPGEHLFLFVPLIAAEWGIYMSFEQAMARLEEIVKTLEKGDASLEDALSLFEEGTALVKNCSKQLDTAEQKIVKLVKGADGNPVETEFDSNE